MNDKIRFLQKIFLYKPKVVIKEYYPIKHRNYKEEINYAFVFNKNLFIYGAQFIVSLVFFKNETWLIEDNDLHYHKEALTGNLQKIS